MASVYDTENFAGRVNHAAAAIVRGQRSTRHFDTCFEMYDGDAVMAALVRRAQKNEKLRQALEARWPSHLWPAVQALALKSPREIAEAAAAMRRSAEAEREAWLAKERGEEPQPPA